MFMQYSIFGPWTRSTSFFPLAYQTEGVLSLPASDRLSVRKLYLVRTITRDRLELESPNLHQTCITGYFQLVLKMGSLTMTFKFILPFDSESRKFGLSARQPVTDLGYHHQICTKHASWDTQLKWRSWTLIFKVILTIVTLNSRKFGLSER